MFHPCLHSTVHNVLLTHCVLWYLYLFHCSINTTTLDVLRIAFAILMLPSLLPWEWPLIIDPPAQISDSTASSTHQLLDTLLSLSWLSSPLALTYCLSPRPGLDHYTLQKLTSWFTQCQVSICQLTSKGKMLLFGDTMIVEVHRVFKGGFP